MHLNTLSSSKSTLPVRSDPIYSTFSNIDRLIRIKEVMSITGLKRSSLYAKIASGNFPQQVKIGVRSAAWKLNEVLRWREDPMSYVVDSDHYER